MNDWLYLLLALFAGMLLGWVHFGGLWLTVNHLSKSRSPALFTLGSFILRTLVVLFGLYLVADGHWQRLAAGMVGLLISRRLILVRYRPTGD